jgi:hypothetical protein
LGVFCGSLLHDQASLNKMVLLPWDRWALMLSETLDDPNELDMFHEVAALTRSLSVGWAISTFKLMSGV